MPPVCSECSRFQTEFYWRQPNSCKSQNYYEIEKFKRMNGASDMDSSLSPSFFLSLKYELEKNCSISLIPKWKTMHTEMRRKNIPNEKKMRQHLWSFIITNVFCGSICVYGCFFFPVLSSFRQFLRVERFFCLFAFHRLPMLKWSCPNKTSMCACVCVYVLL